ncbi:alanine racemase [Pontibaca salina]|uniref:Alanine racemase n=1 Tax=Pontibaca salina TaxID=2795731 RepID=A0A934HIU4_9RHOB|nr:alanine racemase [Pontibaca salina]MBI6628969.1 alanine racemase [Pontibaca salina]
MSKATLTIDLDALVANWRALDALSSCETGAVVKADAYGLGLASVAPALARAGVRKFFVALAHEGALLREVLGPGPTIVVFGGHMAGDTTLIRDHDLTPLLNSADQMLRHTEALPGHAFGIQLDSGMNRLGMEPGEWAAVRDIALAQKPVLIMSHLACANTPDHEMNARQLRVFREMTDGVGVKRSLAATGGTLLGNAFHFGLTRPGIGLYGGQPFSNAKPVVTLDLPVIQTREVAQGETVGYGNAWTAPRASRIATVAAGYGDGLCGALAPGLLLYAGETPCPVVGKVSMDLITADVTDLTEVPEFLRVLSVQQGIDKLGALAGTTGYEILTTLGHRYERIYKT